MLMWKIIKRSTKSQRIWLYRKLTFFFLVVILIGGGPRISSYGSRNIRRKKNLNKYLYNTNKLSIKINTQNHCFLIH